MNHSPIEILNSSALLTDLYQLTMANGYFKLGIHNKQSCFHHFFRQSPFGSAYAIAAGLQNVLEYIEAFHFSKEELEYLSSLQTSSGATLFEHSFIDYLATLKLTCEVDAVEEGTLVFPYEPMFRVRGPLLQCQLLETALLNIVNYQTLVATKASRCVFAAKGREIIDFGLRRAQGPNGGVSGSRAAYVGGCKSTSNVLAGKLFEIPVKGTLAHSWVMAFGDEKEAFRAFAKTSPNNIVLLVDTYHTVTGIRNAIDVAKEFQAGGNVLRGIRLDSGDLGELSKIGRAMLDEAGLFETQIIASGDLDEHRIDALVKAKAPIDVFGVGTRLITAFDEPALGGVYKLTAIETENGWRPVLKISDEEGKSTLPGTLQTRRYRERDKFVGDLIFDEVANKSPKIPDASLAEADFADLLKLVYWKGKRVLAPESLREARQRTIGELGRLEEAHLILKEPALYKVWVDSDLVAQKSRLMEQSPR